MADIPYLFSSNQHSSSQNGSHSKRNRTPSASSVSSLSAMSLPSPMLSPTTYFLEYNLLAEYNLLRSHVIPGVYVLPSSHSSLLWYGIIFIRHGLYQGGIFSFDMYIKDAHPICSCPRVFFNPVIFHPLVDAETGEFDAARAFPNWSNHNHIYQVLHFLRVSFYKFDTEHPSNSHAAFLLESDMELFKDKITRCIEKCAKLRRENCSDDPYRIKLQSVCDDQLRDEIIGKMRRQRAGSKSTACNAQISGLSWMKPGSTQLFSAHTDIEH